MSPDHSLSQARRFSLGFFPTPLVEMKRLSAELGGPRLFIKRDDQTGLAFGGNKTRKLEYLVGEALAKGCDTLVSGGAAQSNHCRQTAAAACAAGLGCHLALGGEAPDVPEGNLLLDTLLGAEIHWGGPHRKGEQIPDIVNQLVSEGKHPYRVPYGGSNTTGAVGFVAAMGELKAQLTQLQQSLTHILFASSSGGTQAGLLVGARLFGMGAKVIGIGIDKGEAGDDPFETHVQALANATVRHLGIAHHFSATDVIVENDFLGDGYGKVGELERRAVTLTARTEGILLDPVYTGRAMGALMAMIESQQLTRADTVLFWHTGGAPALFPYAADLIAPG
ncbi:MAG: D-cysteine desulfhydrase family protein [Desulfosarcinaceae bacterium]|nr:D-cysteine desulfhydrase family protein [Desulfosarcinaceae bacterium]